MAWFQMGGSAQGLAMSTLDWSLPQLESEAGRLWPGFAMEVVAAIASTNSELMRRARAGRLGPTLLLAETQTAGRGRLGRRWHSAESVGDSLTFSLGLPLPVRDWSGLSLAVGVSIAQSLEPGPTGAAASRIGLKWPNDLWWRGRKLGGVLIETVSSGAALYAVIGVGLNIRLPQAGEFATAPAALTELLPGWLAPDALRRILPPLLQAVSAFAEQGFPAFRAAFQARDVLFELEVWAESSAASAASPGLGGVARGVDDSGALLVHTAEGMKRITSSDLSIRPSGPRAPAAIPAD